MDDFGNTLDFHNRFDVHGLAAYVMCAEGTVAHLVSDQLLGMYGVIA